MPWRWKVTCGHLRRNHSNLQTDVESRNSIHVYPNFAETPPPLASYRCLKADVWVSVWPRLTFARQGSRHLYWLWGWLPRLTAHQRVRSHKGAGRLLSRVRSASDYNPFPSSLCLSFATSWQQLFQLTSHEIAASRRETCTSRRWPRIQSASLSFDWALRRWRREEQMTLHPCKQALWGTPLPAARVLRVQQG